MCEEFNLRLAYAIAHTSPVRLWTVFPGAAAAPIILTAHEAPIAFESAYVATFN